MGHLTQSVLEELKGQNLSVSKTHPKSGKPYEKKLAAQQMALLLTVASQQETLSRNECGEAPAWTADPKSICAYTHTGPTAFHEDRNFLVELGLLERVNSSYRVCMAKLRNTESSAEATNKEYIERIAKSIADICGIDLNHIDQEEVSNAIKDKYPDSVYKTIRKIWNNKNPAKRITLNLILITLMALPRQEDDPAYKSKHKKKRHDRGGKGKQTTTMQQQLSAFQAWMIENNHSPSDKYARARDFWYKYKDDMEKAKNAKGEKKGYSSYQALANAYWNDLGNCKRK